jgi:hypothetical protein
VIVNEILRFESLCLNVRTDVPDVGDYCRRLFGRLRDPEGTPAHTLELLSDGPSRWVVRDAVLDATVERPDWLPGIVCARVLETFGNEVDDHDLFHGAALSRHGEGLVLCGESGFGKSTLTLALLARGWSFLSDEVAAVAHDRQVLTPFPKALELLPASAERVGLSIEGAPEKRGKIVHDPERLFPGCMSEACAPKAVVFMDSPRGDSGAPGDRPLRVTVHRRSESVIDELTETDGVTGVSWDGLSEGSPVLEIERDPARFAAWRLDEILARHRLLIVSSSADEQPPADFAGEPRLEPLAAHAGVARLMTCFRGRAAFARRLEQHGDFSALFLSLLERFGSVRFHRLVVGRLEGEVELLEQAVGNPSSA